MADLDQKTWKRKGNSLTFDPRPFPLECQFKDADRLRFQEWATASCYRAKIVSVWATLLTEQCWTAFWRSGRYNYRKGVRPGRIALKRRNTWSVGCEWSVWYCPWSAMQRQYRRSLRSPPSGNRTSSLAQMAGTAVIARYWLNLKKTRWRSPTTNAITWHARAAIRHAIRPDWHRQKQTPSRPERKQPRDELPRWPGACFFHKSARQKQEAHHFG